MNDLDTLSVMQWVCQCIGYGVILLALVGGVAFVFFDLKPWLRRLCEKALG